MFLNAKTHYNSHISTSLVDLYFYVIPKKPPTECKMKQADDNIPMGKRQIKDNHKFLECDI